MGNHENLKGRVKPHQGSRTLDGDGMEPHIYNMFTSIPLNIMKVFTLYALSGIAWYIMLENKTVFTLKKDYERDGRESQWGRA